MSTAMYPLGMKNGNNTLPQGGYKTWKGSGQFANPRGITSTHIRPLTNRDPGNVFPTGFGLPRPIKHYRKGRVIPVHYLEHTSDDNIEAAQIRYNINRAVKSSVGSALEGGGGLISQTIDMPGDVVIKDTNVGMDSDENCKKCNGISIVSNWYPIASKTDTPDAITTTKRLCCNEQRKAIRRTLPGSTLVKKNYYQTTGEYLQGRCQTFKPL